MSLKLLYNIYITTQLKEYHKGQENPDPNSIKTYIDSKSTFK